MVCAPAVLKVAVLWLLCAQCSSCKEVTCASQSDGRVPYGCTTTMGCSPDTLLTKHTAWWTACLRLSKCFCLFSVAVASPVERRWVVFALRVKTASGVSVEWLCDVTYLEGTQVIQWSSLSVLAEWIWTIISGGPRQCISVLVLYWGWITQKLSWIKVLTYSYCTHCKLHFICLY